MLFKKTMPDRKKQARLLSILIGICVFLIVLIWVFTFGKNFFFKRYTHFEPGFTVGYPFDWTYKENVMNTPVIFFSPKDNTLDFFQENLSVVTQNLPPGSTSLKDYSDTAVKQVRAVFEGQIEILADEDTDLAGRPAHKFEYLAKSPQFTFHTLHVWTIDGNNTAYQLTYTALDSSYEKYLPKVRRMIDSFKLK